MKINRKKSGIIFHQSKKGRPQRNYLEEIYGIPVVEEYKYLGIVIDARIAMNKNVNHIEKKIEKARKMIRFMKWQHTDQWKII